MKKQFYLLVAIIVLILASIACQASIHTSFPPGIGADTATPEASPTTESASAPTQQPVIVSSEMLNQQDTLAALYTNVMPGIVSIQVSTADGGSLGTGFVIDTAGHIVTNDHVVDGADAIEVDFSSGYKAIAKLIGTDQDSDLAVIKVDAPESEIHPLTLGDSTQLKVGQSVIAIGNPFGLSGTMTLGIISALGRTQDSNRQSSQGGTFSVAHMIQTDAAINPGNSGGPLFNVNGEVIGVNRSIRTSASNATGEPVNSGIGFALPINLIKRVVPAIIESGKFEYPYLGISSLQTEMMNLQVIYELGLKSMTGVYITGVATGGPAESAGLVGGSKETKITGLMSGGDLIVAIDGKDVKTYDDLIGYLIENKSPGDNVMLTVLRGEEKMELPLTLAKRP